MIAKRSGSKQRNNGVPMFDASQIQADAKLTYCQANIGTAREPRTCGKRVKIRPDGSYRCTTHGEMY